MTGDLSLVLTLAYNAFLFGCIPIFVCVVVALVVFRALWLAMKSERSAETGFWSSATFVVGFASLGGAMGLFMGASREPVVSVTLPALLTFVSGFSAYLFSKDAVGKLRTAIPISILVMIVSAVFCATFGGSMRDTRAKFERDYAYWLKRQETLELPLQLEIGKKNIEIEKLRETKAIEKPGQ